MQDDPTLAQNYLMQSKNTTNPYSNVLVCVTQKVALHFGLFR